jgi:hypothetical protein
MRQRVAAAQATTDERPQQDVPPPAVSGTFMAEATDLPPGRSAREIATGMGAWQRGTLSGRATVSSDSEGNSQT